MLGALPGVVNTRAGWLDGEEVVEVTFDPAVSSYEKVLAASRCVQKPSAVYVATPAHRAASEPVVGAAAIRPWREAKAAKESDRRYHLRQSPFWHLPLTGPQAVRVNAALGARGAKAAVASIAPFLSPRQVALARRLAAAPADRRQELAAELATALGRYR